MSKKNKPEQGSAKPGRIAKKAANITVDMVSTTVSTVLKAVGTVLLILLVTGMMFACVFCLLCQDLPHPEPRPFA